MTANPPIVYFNRPRLHLADEMWPCGFCWGKRIAMTRMQTEDDIPCCPDCAEQTQRKLQMPRFVIASIVETIQ
jgi:hypothetical protein